VSRRQHLIQPFRWDGKYGLPHFSIQPAKVLDSFVPVFIIWGNDGGPLLFSTEIQGMTLDALKHEPVPSGEVKHDFPDAVCSRNGMRRGGFGGNAGQCLEDGGAMPRITLERAAHLVFKAVNFFSHFVKLHHRPSLSSARQLAPKHSRVNEHVTSFSTGLLIDWMFTNFQPARR
jgi:hypothetical protein